MKMLKSLKKIFQRKYKVGLALGGGAARGISHIGVLKALYDHNIPIHCIAGTSVGSLIGGLYAADVDIDTMLDGIRKLEWRDFVGFHFSAKGLMSSKKIENFIEKFIGKISLRELKLPFCAVSTDLLTGKKVVFKDQNIPLSLAIRASASFPGVFSPLRIDNQYFIDGGLSELVPISCVKAMGADFIIAVDVIPDIMLDKLPDNLAIIGDRAVDLILHKNTVEDAKKADVLLRPIDENINSFDIKKADQLIALGVRAVEDNLPKLKKVMT